jgi:hypothetical protein
MPGRVAAAAFLGRRIIGEDTEVVGIIGEVERCFAVSAAALLDETGVIVVLAVIDLSAGGIVADAVRFVADRAGEISGLGDAPFLVQVGNVVNHRVPPGVVDLWSSLL